MPVLRVDRVLLIVCDSFGVGAAPDAEAYGDAGSNTLGHVAASVGGLHAPNLAALGMGSLAEIQGVAPGGTAGTAHGKAAERSAGKDTTTGHWEIGGIVLDGAFPTYPNGFPPEIIEPFSRAIGREVLGNRAASGTEIIAELGEEHVRTGRPIVYTSADSVFQIATHVDVVPLEQLYEWCRGAREILTGEHRMGRVIARPFAGPAGAFARTPDRRDFSVAPPGDTVLDRCLRAGVGVFGVGKIGDIYSGHGLSEYEYSRSNDDGIDITLSYLERTRRPLLVMTNLVDFDSKYGHRNDPSGYGACVEAFDARIPELRDAVGGGLLFITGDHGCDPMAPGTDHTREFTPVLVAGTRRDETVDLGVRDGFGDLGATVAEVLGVPFDGLAGTSFGGSLG